MTQPDHESQFAAALLAGLAETADTSTGEKT